MKRQEIRLTNPHQCSRLLNRTVNDLLNDEIKTDQARCIGYLVSILLKGIEVENIEARVQALEKGEGEPATVSDPFDGLTEDELRSLANRKTVLVDD